VSAQSGAPGYATVVRVAGAAFYSLGAGQDEHPLVAGKTLPVGATIRTEDNGVVDVVLGKSMEAPQSVWQPQRIAFAADSPVRGMVGYKPSAEQNVVRLTPDTTLAIDKLNVTDTGADTVSDTELNLKKGKIFASVKKLTGASQYLIKLPNGIAGVRGTMFVISADGTVEVFESTGGGVVLSLVSQDGSTHTYLVTPGQLLDPVTGKSSPIPADLVNQLNQVFAALRTVYGEVVNFSFDTTKCYVSPTHGYSGGGSSSGPAL
ncbi:MAG TPA: FecR domain-containing protein, partial [Candidatus Binatia bacterium]|nr:FecR domain-containing protein [Candidatus Binatia bacterium]